MYEYMPHMCIFVTALSNMPLLMLCMFPHGLYSLLDYEINLSFFHVIKRNEDSYKIEAKIQT